MKITSLQNNLVKYWVSLREKKNRDKDKVFLIEGDHLIKEAQKLNLIVYTISCLDENSDYYVTKEIINKISNQKSSANTLALVKYINPRDIQGNCLILDNLQDPGNLGTLIRSATAFNFDSIILSNDSVDLYNPKTIRATQGLLFKINILREDILKIIEELKKNNYIIIGTSVKPNIDINNLPKERIALVIGNEGQGISKEVFDLCDYVVNIKMNSNVESLNASVAGSILMYEVNK